jgi:hypothetical protein
VDHIIPEKGLTKAYIKGLALGVGSSERKRLITSSTWEKVFKLFSELIKIFGTVLLFFAFALRFKIEAAWMLVKFRFWVASGYL